VVDLEFIRSLIQPADTKIVFLILDGLGGLPADSNGSTELEAAETPNLDNLAARGICGLHVPVAAGITPGSGPAHLGLFGYDPLKYQVGRGVLSALGIGFDLRSNDVAARGNFCTVDKDGVVTDRRAGRIASEKNRELCALLREIELPEVQLFVETVKEYRFLLVLRGDGLSGDIADTDPLQVGRKPLEPRALSAEADQTVQLVDRFVEQAREVLPEQQPANMVLLRGFSKRPDWPLMKEVFGLRAAVLAHYPMYRGVARLVGMEVLDSGETLGDQFAALREHWNDYDFFFVHVKRMDSAGEDGDFRRKAELIEEVDPWVPVLMHLHPDVVVVTGDHSTPSQLKYHSWHPVPVLLWSEHCRTDGVKKFGERACMAGGLGPRLPAVDLMPIALTNALRLVKFGA